MSTSRSSDFDKSSTSLNSTINDGYATADDNDTRYYSILDATDSTIEANTSEIVDSVCTMDTKIVIDTILGPLSHNDNVDHANEQFSLSAVETKLTTSMPEETLDETRENIDEGMNENTVGGEETVKHSLKPEENPVNIVENIGEMKDNTTLEESALEMVEREKPITDPHTGKLENSIFVDVSGQIGETPEGNVLLYKIEIPEKMVAATVDPDENKDSLQDDNEKIKSIDETNNEPVKQGSNSSSQTDKETESCENYVEEYLDEEYLEYETVEGEPVTGDSNPQDIIMTPSDSDDDASDNSPVMAYLERNENLNFYKNNPQATGLPVQAKQNAEKVSLKKTMYKKISPISNGLTSVLLKSSDMPIITYTKNAGRTPTEPKYALIKEATLYSSIPRAKKPNLEKGRPSNVVNVLKMGDSKNENVLSIKKPRERKQVLEPANVDVVFELEKVKKEEEAVKKAKKKTAMKITKSEQSSSTKKDNPSKVKRKLSQKSEPVKEQESPMTPHRQSKRLSRKSNKKKKCAIASCKCDLDHEHEQSDDDSEVDSNKYENTSDYSDEWQLSPKSVSHTSPPKVKVYSNVRKRQHSHKSTFDDDEDEMSNDLLTLMREDEKSNKEIDLNKEFPEKGAVVTSPMKKFKSEKSSMDHDDISLFNNSMTLISTEDEEEFIGFEPKNVPSHKLVSPTKHVSIFNLHDSNEANVEEIKQIPTTSACVESTIVALPANTSKTNKLAIKHECSICNKAFPLRVHLVVHEKTHKITSTCRYCSETFSYPSALKEHIKRSCAIIKDDEKKVYLEELNKMKNAPITKPKGIPMRLNTPRRMKLVRKTSLKRNAQGKVQVSPLRKASIKVAMKSKLPRTPQRVILQRTINTSASKKQQINNLDKQVRVIHKPVVQRYSTMKRRSQNILQEINKTNNNETAPTTSSKADAVQTYKCENCKLDFKSAIALQKHKSTHKNTQYKCSKCKAEFRNQMLLSKHGPSCNEQPPSERPTRRSMQVSTLNQILISNKNNKDKAIPLRKVRAHSGVPLSSKMQKVLAKIKKGDLKNINSTP